MERSGEDEERQMFKKIVAVVAVMLSPALLWGEPVISFAEKSVVAEGLTPGSDAIWFAVVKQMEGWMRVIIRVDEVTEDSDFDGVVELEWGRPIPRHSVWMVVDSQTGDHAAAVPEGMIRREYEFSLLDLVLDHESVLGFVQQRTYLEVTLVSPALQGAWGMTVNDGSEYDADGNLNGRVQINFSNMHPVYQGGQAPESAPFGGVILMIDPKKLEFCVMRLLIGDKEVSR